MRRVTIVLVLAVAVQSSRPVFSADQLPWEVNAPIVNIEKSVYKACPKPGAAAIVHYVDYVGPELERQEIHALEKASDSLSERAWRFSKDNGRPWTELQPVYPRATHVGYKGVSVRETSGTHLFDPLSKVLLNVWLRQQAVGGLYHNATYWRVSRNHGQTWSEPQQFRYENGDEFDPNNPLNTSFLQHNQGYPGNNILRLGNGTLVFGLSHANAPGDPDNDKRPWRMGSILLLGNWNAQKQDYEWTPGARVEVSPEQSARGLLEPEVAELKDGRLLVVWRTSTHGWDGSVAKIPGRKFFSISTDGGRTLSPPAEWKYADGASFYSPSSYHRMIRHSETGKLYWLGNISATPPRGNSPRYPLIIAEVDETAAALKKQTVTVIDDRRPGQPADIQFSNFSLLENRETHALELYLTAYGEDPKDWRTANCYKYVVTLK